MSQEITQVTRRAIIDYLTASNISWSGRLEETDFLARLYDLANMRSTDGRFSNAAGDIFQHRIRNHDWNDDWVFYDQRFNLLHGPDEDFLRFLNETIHPVVRPDPSEARALAKAYNQELAVDGWELVEAKQISGGGATGGGVVGVAGRRATRASAVCVRLVRPGSAGAARSVACVRQRRSAEDQLMKSDAWYYRSRAPR